MKKYIVFINEKIYFFSIERDKAQNSGFLLIITGWGKLGKVNIAVFRAMSKKILGKDGSAPFKKLACMPMVGQTSDKVC